MRGLFEYGMEDGFERRVLHWPKHWFELVPKNWELVQRRPDGTTQTIASNVMAYTVGRQGNLYCFNGKGVLALARPGAKPEKISNRKLVSCLAEIG